jgi:nucleotide-binding universal stress UspA family protein
MKFLVAIDGSQASEHALAKALTFAVPLKAEIVLLTVVEPLSSYIPEVMLPTGDWVGWRGLPDIELERKILNAGQALLQKAKDNCQSAQMDGRTRLETGQPRDVICYVAKEESPDLVIIGSRGLGSVERLMLGSVSDYVVHHCASPVLVVR